MKKKNHWPKQTAMVMLIVWVKVAERAEFRFVKVAGHFLWKSMTSKILPRKLDFLIILIIRLIKLIDCTLSMKNLGNSWGQLFKAWIAYSPNKSQWVNTTIYIPHGSASFVLLGRKYSIAPINCLKGWWHFLSVNGECETTNNEGKQWCDNEFIFPPNILPYFPL